MWLPSDDILESRSFAFAIYRNPGGDNSVLDCLMNSMAVVQESDQKASYVFKVEFNAHN